MKSVLFRMITVMLLAFAICLPAQAQDDETDGVSIMWQFDINAGEEDAFEEAVKEFHRFMADKEGAFHWDWYVILTGPHTGKYVARSANHNWADMDAEYDWEEEVDAYVDEHLAKYMASATRTFTRPNKDVQAWPDENPGFKFFNVENWYVHNGQGRTFSEGLKKIHSHLQEGGFPVSYGFFYTVSGGKGNQVQLVTGHKNWADMADPEPSFDKIMSEAMEPEEMAEFMQSWSKSFKPGENWTVVWRKDLSHLDEED